MYGRYKHEIKQQNAPENETPTDVLANQRKSNYRYHIAYKVSDAVKLKSRVEFVLFDDGVNEREKGYLVYQDIEYKALSFPLSFSTRFALFETDSYDARIYAYENDVLYSFSIPAYQNKGTRYYLVLKYHISKGIDVWLRFAQTFHSNKETIGSGLEEINGNVKSEVKAQVRFKF